MKKLANRRPTVPAYRLDAAALRGALAVRRVKRLELAAAAGLSPSTVTRLLGESREPGELALLKLRSGLEALDFDPDLYVPERGSRAEAAR